MPSQARANRYSRRETGAGESRGNAGSHTTWRCALQSTHKKARTVGKAVRRAWRPTGGLAAWGSRTRSVMSPVAPEARDCFQEGPGLPPKWPYRLTPDCSDLPKIGQGSLAFKALFSMTRDLLIGAIVLTGRDPAWRTAPRRNCARTPKCAGVSDHCSMCRRHGCPAFLTSPGDSNRHEMAPQKR
jgi:hypothetical protein